MGRFLTEEALSGFFYPLKEVCSPEWSEWKNLSVIFFDNVTLEALQLILTTAELHTVSMGENLAVYW